MIWCLFWLMIPNYEYFCNQFAGFTYNDSRFLLAYFSIGAGLGVSLYPSIFGKLLNGKCYSVWIPFILYAIVQGVKLGLAKTIVNLYLHAFFSLFDGLNVAMALMGAV